MLAGITSSVLISLGTFIISSIFSLISMKMKAEQQRNDFALAAFRQESKEVQQVREIKDTGFKITRRIIALTFTFCLLVVPSLPYIVMSLGIASVAVPIHIGYDVITSGWWPFSGESRELVWYEIQGIALLPIHWDLYGMIVGLYFGNKVSK